MAPTAAGGRVYFDELGPPWPKHACTDNAPVASHKGRGEEGYAGAYRWQREGWKPFIVTLVQTLAGEVKMLVYGSNFDPAL